MTSQYDDNRQYRIQLAMQNPSKGIIEEPRLYFDTITLPTARFGEIIAGHQEVFRNGERFPVRITHMAFAMARLDGDAQPATQAETLIQRFGARLRFHDQFYMNNLATGQVPGVDGQITPIPVWGNKVVATAPATSFSTSTWGHQPWVYSSRDTLTVELRLDADPAEGAEVTVNVTFSGIGMQSARPYIFTGNLTLDSAGKTTIPPRFFANDGAEPVLITDTSINIGGPLNSIDATGDTRQVLVNVRQVGNGTGANWVQGPLNDPTVPVGVAPAVLWGARSGRAVIHEFPGQGLIWEKGEGLELDMQMLVDTGVDSRVHAAMLGYIMVQ